MADKNSDKDKERRRRELDKLEEQAGGSFAAPKKPPRNPKKK